MKYRIKEKWKKFADGYTTYSGKNHSIEKKYPPIYISNLGNVRGREVCIDSRGYLDFSFRNKSYKLHKLVAELFISNPENKPCIDHINRNRLDNRASNLRWCTVSENSRNTCRNKKCICIETGQIFNTCSEAEEFYKLRRNTVANICNPNQKQKAANNLHFKYYEEEIES